MKDHDWSMFCKRINVSCSIADAYHAWSTRSGLEKWFLRKAEFKSKSGALRKPEEPLQIGDTYEWMWYGWSDDVVEHGEVLDANGKDFFRFSFGKAGIVSIKITSEHGETITELKQDNIPQDEESKIKFHLGCLEGWTFYLANLKSILQGGLDLRNKNLKIGQIINA